MGKQFKVLLSAGVKCGCWKQFKVLFSSGVKCGCWKQFKVLLRQCRHRFIHDVSRSLVESSPDMEIHMDDWPNIFKLQFGCPLLKISLTISNIWFFSSSAINISISQKCSFDTPWRHYACRENIGVFLNRWKSWLSQSIGTNHTIEEVSKGAVNCLLRSSHDVPAGQYIFSTQLDIQCLHGVSKEHFCHHRIWRYIWMIGQTFSNYNSVVLYLKYH
jgi:hypothetical protein